MIMEKVNMFEDFIETFASNLLSNFIFDRFRNGKQYTYTITQKTSASFITFAETGYKHAQGVDVMPPPSPL